MITIIIPEVSDIGEKNLFTRETLIPEVGCEEKKSERPIPSTESERVTFMIVVSLQYRYYCP